jgi:hypothetical protein
MILVQVIIPPGILHLLPETSPYGHELDLGCNCVPRPEVIGTIWILTHHEPPWRDQ